MLIVGMHYAGHPHKVINDGLQTFVYCNGGAFCVMEWRLDWPTLVDVSMLSFHSHTTIVSGHVPYYLSIVRVLPLWSWLNGCPNEWQYFCPLPPVWCFFASSSLPSHASCLSYLAKPVDVELPLDCALLCCQIKCNLHLCRLHRQHPVAMSKYLLVFMLDYVSLLTVWSEVSLHVLLQVYKCMGFSLPQPIIHSSVFFCICWC